MPRSRRIEPEAAAGIPGSDADTLADRLRATLPAAGLSEQRMFGGIGFMLNGNMIAGASKRGLLLRVGKDSHEHALTRPGARAMEMKSRPVKGYIHVDPADLDDAALRDWLQLALAFVRALPPKPSRPKPGRTKGGRK
jgi:TfoX/Sxy family transcriptional regulator of competence genes